MLHSIISKFRFASLLLLLGLGACSSLSEMSQDEIYTQPQPGGRFVWHDLITHDLASVRDFYAELFGWEFEQAEPREGHPYLLAKLDGRYAAGIIELPRPQDGQSYTRWLAYMTVDDIDQALDAANAGSGRVVVAKRDLGRIGKAAVISDPQGAILGLIETSLDPDRLTLSGAAGGIVWDELLADDDQAAAGFYSTLAGYQAASIDRRGGRYIMLRADDTERAGILKNPFAATDPLWLSYFGVDDPAAAAARAASLGGKVILAPSPELREGSMAVIQDPGGAILALQKITE